MSFSKQVARASVVGGISFAINVVLTLAQVPILLRLWGVEASGAWLSLTAGVSILTVLDTGHHSYIGNELAAAPDDHRSGRRLLGSAVLIAFCAAAIQSLAALLLWLTGLGVRLLGISNATGEQLHIGQALMLLVTQWAFTFSSIGLLSRIYTVQSDITRSIWCNVIYRGGSSILVIGVAFAGGRIIHAAWANAIFSVAFVIVQYYDLKHRYPAYFPLLPSASFSTGAKNFVTSLGMVIVNLCGQLTGSGLVLILAASRGAGVVVEFTTHRTFLNTIVTVSAVFLTPVTPELSRLRGGSDNQRLNQIVNTAVAVSVNAMICFMIACTMWGPWAYDAWTRHRLSFSLSLAVIFLLAVTIRVIAAPLANVLIAVNDVRGQLIAGVGSAFVTVLFAMVGVRYYGALGVAGSLIAGEIGAFLLVARRLSVLPADYSIKVEAKSVRFCIFYIVGLSISVLAWTTGGTPGRLVALAGLAGIIVHAWGLFPVQLRRRITAFSGFPYRIF